MVQRNLQTPPPRGSIYDWFPDLGEEIDRRIAHSEMRIKYWIIAGVVANLLALLVGAVPMVYYFGQMTEKMSSMIIANESAKLIQRENELWHKRRELWEAQVESRLQIQPKVNGG